jgi:hypothetical protein
MRGGWILNPPSSENNKGLGAVIKVTRTLTPQKEVMRHSVNKFQRKEVIAGEKSRVSWQK